MANGRKDASDWAESKNPTKEFSYKFQNMNFGQLRCGETEEISERDMAGRRKGTPEADASIKYGHAARQVEIAALGGHGVFVRLKVWGIPVGSSAIRGRFVYTTTNKPLKSGYAKNRDSADVSRKLDARFGVYCLQESPGVNASEPTVQLQSISVVLPIIAYRKWNVRATDASRAFSEDAPLDRETYAQPPYAFGRNESITRG